MNRAIVLILGFILVFSFGCIEETPVEPVGQEPQGPTPPNCGADFDCFILASEDCTPANLMHTQSVNLFGMVNTVENYMEILGKKSGDCLYYQRTESSAVELSEDLRESLLEAGNTEADIDAVEKDANENAQLAVGTEINCTMEETQLNQMLKRWKSGSTSSGDLGGAECVVTPSEALEEANARLEQERKEAEEANRVCVPVAMEAEVEIGIYPENTVNFEYGEEEDGGAMFLGETLELDNDIEIFFENVTIDATCEACGEKPVWTGSQQAKLIIRSEFADEEVLYVDQGEHGSYVVSYVCKTVGFETDCIQYIPEEMGQYYIWKMNANKRCE